MTWVFIASKARRKISLFISLKSRCLLQVCSDLNRQPRVRLFKVILLISAKENSKRIYSFILYYKKPWSVFQKRINETHTKLRHLYLYECMNIHFPLKMMVTASFFSVNQCYRVLPFLCAFSQQSLNLFLVLVLEQFYKLKSQTWIVCVQVVNIHIVENSKRILNLAMSCVQEGRHSFQVSHYEVGGWYVQQSFSRLCFWWLYMCIKQMHYYEMNQLWTQLSCSEMIKRVLLLISSRNWALRWVILGDINVNLSFLELNVTNPHWAKHPKTMIHYSVTPLLVLESR